MQTWLPSKKARSICKVQYIMIQNIHIQSYLIEYIDNYKESINRKWWGIGLSQPNKGRVTKARLSILARHWPPWGMSVKDLVVLLVSISLSHGHDIILIFLQFFSLCFQAQQVIFWLCFRGNGKVMSTFHLFSCSSYDKLCYWCAHSIHHSSTPFMSICCYKIYHFLLGL